MRSGGESFRTEIPGYGMVSLDFYMHEVGKPRAAYINLAYAWDFIFGSARWSTMIKWLNRYERRNGNVSDGLEYFSQRTE